MRYIVSAGYFPGTVVSDLHSTGSRRTRIGTLVKDDLLCDTKRKMS